MSNQIQKIKEGLLSPAALTTFKDNLPKATGKHAEEAAKRFAKMVYTTICQNPTLQQCSLASIIKAASMSASLDLDIDVRGLAYLVPYKNKGVSEAQLQIGYLGLIELAYRSGRVKSIAAHCIYESERDKVKIKRVDGQFQVEHPFGFKKPSGNIIAVYATAEVEGVSPQTIILRAEEVEQYRQISKAPDSPAWKNHYEAMAKKTAIRQLAKFLPKSIVEDFARAAAIDERENFVEAQVSAEEQIKAEAGSEVIDVNFEDDKSIENEESDPETKAKAKEQIDKLKTAEGKQEPAFMKD